MELPDRGQKGSYPRRWRESYLLRDEGATVLDTDGEGSTRELQRKLPKSGRRGSYLGRM
jgi:hypothetical protein